MTNVQYVRFVFFETTNEFDFHSKAALASQSSFNNCILFLKKCAYYYSFLSCVVTCVLKVVGGLLVAYGVMCMWCTFPDVNSR